MYGAQTGIAAAVHSALTFIGGWSSPAKLFAQGEQGAWFDVQDYGTSGTNGVGTLYQDSAGTTPVTAVEQPVGLMLDKRKGIPAITELLTNNDFATDTVWSKGTGWTIAAGVATKTAGSASTLSQSVSVTAGVTYRVVYTITRTAGTITPQLTGGSTVSGASRSASGTYVDTLTAVSGNVTFEFSADASFAGTVDNVYLKRVAGNDAYQTTSAARPTLRARYNVITYSEDVTNVVWVKNATATTPTATTVSFPAANDYIHQTLTAATYAAKSVTISVELSGSGTTAFGFYDNVSGFQVDAVTLTATPTRYTATKTIGTGAVDVRLIPAGRLSGGTATSVTVTKIDVRMSNLIGTGIPLYQRIAAATDYDTVGFPVYIQGNGSSQFMQTASIDFSGTDKITLFAAARKLNDTNGAVIFSTGVGSGPAFEMRSSLNAATADVGFYTIGTIGVTTGSPATYPAPQTNVITATADIAAAREVLRVNGAQAAASNNTLGTGNYSNFPLYLFTRSGTSFWFGGFFYGAIIRGAASNEAQIRLGERYLQQRSLAY